MSERRHLVADLFKAYASQKAREEWHGEWGAALLYRPAAILLAPPLLRLGVSATAVTLVSLLAALSLPALAYGDRAYLAVGLTAVLVAILDCLDGTIARARGTVSDVGHYLDFMTDIVTRGTLYAAIGLMAGAMTPLWLQGWVLPLALVAALLAIAARLCRVYGERFAGEGREEQNRAHSFSSFAFSAISGIDQLLPLAVILLGAFGLLGWLVLWLLAYSALDFVHTQFNILRRL
jgi:phosphatidylglycerophosphate synthase